MSTIDTCSDIMPATRARVSPNAGATLNRFVLDVVETIERMVQRRRSRRALLEMNDAQLKDIGISRADAEREGLRQPWR